MRRRHSLLPTAAALALAVALAGGCADEATPTTTGTGPAPSPDTTIAGDGWQGVLLGSGVDWLELADGTLVEDVESFTPTEDDAQRFEDQLPAALDDASNPSGEQVSADDLDGYVRQYTGVEGGGARQLVVAGICDGAAADLDWQDGWIEVNDGGACFWDATMDLETGEILRLYFHGSA
jgi:hypothetical protein